MFMGSRIRVLIPYPLKMTGSNRIRIRNTVGSLANSLYPENKTLLNPWVQRCSGILLDFGVSELQANSCRGFHPQQDEPLGKT